jgi:hypothetical protein
MAAATESAPSAAGPRRRAQRPAAGPDRLTLLLLSLTAFFAALAFLASDYTPQFTASRPRSVIVLRRVYETRVIEQVPPNVRAVGGVSSTTQSASGSVSPTPTTRTSG